MQGFDGHAFLIGSTISSGPFTSRVAVRPGPLQVAEISGGPTSKAERAAIQFLAEYHISLTKGGRILLKRGIPVGKGNASSSTDVFLTCLALAFLHGQPAPPAMLYDLACRIERSDPVHMAGQLVLARQTKGEIRVLGPMPRTMIVAWDTAVTGEIVDTAEAAVLDEQRRVFRNEYRQLLTLASSGSWDDFRLACTESARLNQQWLPKPGFDWTLRLAQDVEGAVVVAHSGTFVGIAIPEGRPKEQIAEIRREVDRQSAGEFFPNVFLTGVAR